MKKVLNNFTIGQKIAFGIGISLFALILTVGLTFQSLQSLSSDFAKVEELVKDNEVVSELKSDVLLSEVNTFQWLQHRDQKTYDTLKDVKDKVTQDIKITRDAI